MGVVVGVWMGVGCPCPPVRNDIVTARHLLLIGSLQLEFHHTESAGGVLLGPNFHSIYLSLVTKKVWCFPFLSFPSSKGKMMTPILVLLSQRQSRIKHKGSCSEIWNYVIFVKRCHSWYWRIVATVKSLLAILFPVFVVFVSALVDGLLFVAFHN